MTANTGSRPFVTRAGSGDASLVGNDTLCMRRTDTIPALFLGCIAGHVSHIQQLSDGLSDLDWNDADAHPDRETL